MYFILNVHNITQKIKIIAKYYNKIPTIKRGIF